MMTKNPGISLIIYGLGIAGLGYAIYQMAPTMAQPTLIAGLAGGALSLLWGLQWLRGRGRKVWPVLTLIVVCYVLLGQTISAWMKETNTMVASLLTLALVISFVALLRVVYHGVFKPDSSPSPEPHQASASAQRKESTNRRAFAKAAFTPPHPVADESPGRSSAHAPRS